MLDLGENDSQHLENLFKKREVEEELCVAVDSRKSAATPFFDHVTGKILIRGGKVVNDDGVTDADVLVPVL